MRIGRCSELSVDRGFQEHEVMKDADVKETSGELGSALGGTLVGAVKNTMVISIVESAIFVPLVSVDTEYQDRWCALNSPSIRLSCVVRRCSIEG